MITMDSTTTIQDLKDGVRDMCQYRGWGGEKAIQNPQRMVMAMAIEVEVYHKGAVDKLTII